MELQKRRMQVISGTKTKSVVKKFLTSENQINKSENTDSAIIKRISVTVYFLFNFKKFNRF